MKHTEVTTKMHSLLLVAGSAALLGVVCGPSRPTADAIYRNANVITAADDFTIADGFLADFVVLSNDILAVPPDAVRNLRVERTFIGGREIGN